MTLTLLTGGARSGKSALAVRRASQHDAPVVFVATGQAGDDEMAARIARHRAERPSAWSTVEAPYDLADAVTAQNGEATLIVDCLALWVSNLGERGDDDAEVTEHAVRLARACRDRDGATIVVTNEVGSGLVPMHPLGRSYRDTLGRVNVEVARHADLVQLVVAGRTLTLEVDELDAAGTTKGGDHG